MTSALATLNFARNLKGDELVKLYSDAFSADSLHYVTANNTAPLEEGMISFPMGKNGIKGEQNKAIADATSKAFQALKASLPNQSGWLGSVNGSFNKASKETRATYLECHASAVELFSETLRASGQFNNPTVKTAEEKAQAKSEKDQAKAKASAEALEAAKKALIASGELVDASTILTIDKLATSALVDELINRDADTFSEATRALLVVLLERLSVTA